MFALIALLMATIVNTALAGATVTYNGVQFGGSDATYPTTPPMYAFRGVHRYDESRRAILGVDYLLTLKCIAYGTTETQMGIQLAAMRERLAVPGGLLTILGLGSGFGTISVGGTFVDLANGPLPQPLEAVPLGQACWELSWAVQFFISECVEGAPVALAFLAFNFNTTWRNDFEGLGQRIISGHVIIPQMRNYAAPKTVLHVAEETRGNIVVSVPPNFQRTENTWRESDDKSRLDFTIVDEMLEGDVLPAGITAGSGSFNFSSSDDSGAMAHAVATLSMSLKTAPNQPRNLAGQVFMTAALSKQNELSSFDADTGKPTITVVPIRLSITNGKFSRARQTDCSLSWMMTKCLSDMMAAANIWSPVGDNDYTAWKASMSALWDNRGFAGIGSSASEAVIIDLCDGVTSKTIGAAGSSPVNPSDSSLPSLACPSIPDDGGWLHFDLDIRVHRSDSQSNHRRAAAYLPGAPSAGDTTDPKLNTAVPLGGVGYSQAPSDQHVVEHHGYPETLIGLSFAGLRFKNKPFMPVITTVRDFPVVLKSQEGGEAKWAFDSFGCPVWSISGYRVYSVPGYVGRVEAIGSKSSCGAPTVPLDY